MPNIRPIATDDDGARILGAMIQGSRDTESGVPAGNRNTNVGAVVVEIREDIDDEDFDQHPAILMKLVGDEFEETQQTVYVRNISRQGIAATEDEPVRTIARPVSNLGLCIESPPTVGVITIRFRIVAAIEYCAECYAKARIISGPPNSPDPDSLPGTEFDYEAGYYTIRVYDMGEGWLNYPPEELLNMIGHATWLRSYEDGPCSEVPSLHWEIIDMQDPEEEVCES